MRSSTFSSAAPRSFCAVSISCCMAVYSRLVLTAESWSLNLVRRPWKTAASFSTAAPRLLGVFEALRRLLHDARRPRPAWRRRRPGAAGGPLSARGPRRWWIRGVGAGSAVRAQGTSRNQFIRPRPECSRARSTLCPTGVGDRRAARNWSGTTETADGERPSAAKRRTVSRKRIRQIASRRGGPTNLVQTDGLAIEDSVGQAI